MKCRDCKGKKTYLGAGMYAPENCQRCRGTGKEPMSDEERHDHEIARELAKKPRPLLNTKPKTLQKAYKDGGDIELAPSGGITKTGDIRLRGGDQHRRDQHRIIRDSGQVTYGLTDGQRAEVQEMIREGTESLQRQIGALQQELARLREPRSRPEEQVISNMMELEPGASGCIPLQPMNANRFEPYALQRMLVAAVPVDLERLSNGQALELPVVVESSGTRVDHQPILLADIVSTAGPFEVAGFISPMPCQELTVQVKNPTTEKVLVTATAWVVQRQPDDFNQFRRMRYGR